MELKRFKLPTILPEESVLILNQDSGILSLLLEGDLLEQQVLSSSEMSLIVPLLEAYPEYCSNEKLLSILTHESEDTCRQQISQALRERTLRTLTKPLREMIVRCRKKLRPFGVEIVTLYETGCILSPLTRELETRMTSEKLLTLHSGRLA